MITKRPETVSRYRVIRTICKGSEFHTLSHWLSETRPTGHRLVQVTDRQIVRDMGALIAETEYTAIWEHEK